MSLGEGYAKKSLQNFQDSVPVRQFLTYLPTARIQPEYTLPTLFARRTASDGATLAVFWCYSERKQTIRAERLGQGQSILILFLHRITPFSG